MTRRIVLAAGAGLVAGFLVLAPTAIAAGQGALILGAASVAAAVTLAILALLGRGITRQLGSLVTAAERRADDERATAEAERDRLSVLVDELGEAILIAGPDDRIESANRAASDLLGPGALPGRSLVEVIRDHEILGAVAAARAGAEQVAMVERSDPPRFLRAVARRLDGAQLLLVIQDLTALRRLETVRTDFVANVSHELRTPLTSLKAMAETLEAGAIDDPAAARDFIGRMHREIDALAQLVEELLALSRLESDRADLRREAVAPVDLLYRARDRMAALAARAGLEIALDAPALPPVHADAERVGQVLANLVHNAVKYTPRGGRVTLSACRVDGAVAFSVTDTGEGIAADDLARVFERFFKSDRSRASGGTGLGLAIAKHVVHAHGGEITARSDGPGRGASFTFTLPIAR